MAVIAVVVGVELLFAAAVVVGELLYLARETLEAEAEDVVERVEDGASSD